MLALACARAMNVCLILIFRVFDNLRCPCSSPSPSPSLHLHLSIFNLHLQSPSSSGSQQHRTRPSPVHPAHCARPRSRSAATTPRQRTSERAAARRSTPGPQGASTTHTLYPTGSAKRSERGWSTASLFNPSSALPRGRRLRCANPVSFCFRFTGRRRWARSG